MNRAKTNTSILLALLSGVLSLSLSQSVPAQARLSGTANGLSNGVPLAGPLLNQHYYAGGKNDVIPPWMLRRKIPASMLGKGGVSRAPGDNAVIRQTVLLTKADPTQQFSGTPAPSQDEHPNFSIDEKYIYFDSDRVSDTNTAENATKTFNMYRMFPDGSGIAQLLPDTTNQIEPNIALDGNRVAYVGGGIINFTSGLDTPTTTGFSLFTYDISNGGTPINLSRNNSSGIVFSDVRHPSWAPGGSEIVFAGQTAASLPYHLYKVNTQTGLITQLTTGNSNDTSPAWSPDGHVIAFTTNGKAFNTAGPTSATTLTANPAQTDIWVVTPNVPALDPHQVTNSSSIQGGLVSSNKNAAWSTTNPDALGIIPGEPGSGGGTSENLLAFASNRADSNGDGVANAIKTTFDIYYLHAGIHVDPAKAGIFTVTTPETVGNLALKLRTSTPDTAIDPNDPTSRFDPNFVSNEDFPCWPAYLNSYRIVYQSDRGMTASAPGAELNIWASTIFDINAPALLKYDIPSNEIVHVARDSSPTVAVREVSAGEKVRFGVRAVDYESGIESAYLMIKCPGSLQKNADGKEHKIFFVGPGGLDNTTTVINAPFESDAQGIAPYINSPTGHFRPVTNPGSTNAGIAAGMSAFYAARLGGLPAGWPSFNQYLAGIDDATAFSGLSHPPDYVEESAGLATKGIDYQNDGSYWLRLWDDGPISKGGHEPEGETAGDGLYTSTWTTPSGMPSDWTLDVIIRDRALDPFAPGSKTVGNNWKIYDNIWGFTTQPFQGNNGILYVNDYDSGQRFYQTQFGPATTFLISGGFLSSNFNGWPVESWMTEFDPLLFPTQAIQGTTPKVLDNFLTPLGDNAYADGATQDAGFIPITGKYDIWRVLCRGPVPDSILNTYKGHIEVQPADVISGGTGPHSVFVAERCVFWHSPYAGDLFVGPGTIVDNDTQVRLAAFVKTGGRLFLNGQDTAWALSLGQVGASSPFLSGTFKITFAADSIGNWPPVVGSETYVPRNARGTGPISWETWYDAFHPNYLGPTIPNEPPGTGNFYRGSDPAPGTTRTFGALNQFSVDRVTFTAPSTPDVSGIDAVWSVDQSPAITWLTDSSASPIVSKVVFGAGGWEAINPEYFVPANGHIVLKSRRAELVHNVGDYLRTGRIFGVIRNVTGTQPLKGVFVRAVSLHTGKTVSTALTLSDGSYVLDGLDATGGYGIDAALPGFFTQHGVANLFHGGYHSRVDVFMTQAQAGSIAGTITVQATGSPVSGIVVKAVDNTTGDTFTGTSQTDGTYIIRNVPSNTTTGYTVTTPLAANGGTLDTLGYGGSSPVSYPKVIVNPSQAVTGIDFKLILVPGSISGHVYAHSTGSGSPVPIAGATVTATAVVGTKVYVSTPPTGADGAYTIPLVDPGVYKVVATAPGFAPSGPKTVTVNTKLNTVVDFIDDASGSFGLVPVPPGTITGLVETSKGIPIPGATVEVVDVNGLVIKDSNGNPLTTTSVAAVNGINYTLTNVPAGGTVLVTAFKSGYLPNPAPVQSVTVAAGPATTGGINFTIDPLNTFESGTFPDGTPILSLVSAPYEYTGVANNSIATLFGVPTQDVTGKQFSFSTWVTASSTYVFYPTPPADTFHLGVGYFLSDSDGNTSLALTIKGTPAEQTVAPDPTHAGFNSIDGSFRIALKPGWNLIGEPFPYSVNFLNLKVVGADGTISDVLGAQTGSNPTLGAALWTYQSGTYQVAYTLDAYRGYWVRAFDNRPAGARATAPNITLIVSPDARQDRSAHSDTRGVLSLGNRQTDGWTLNMVASVGNRKSAPTIVGQTRAALDTYDRFKLEAPPAVSTKDVTMAFEHPEWADKAGRYSADVRSASSLTQKWTFTVTSTLPNEAVTLNWPNLAQVSRQKDLVLTDLDTKAVMDLRGRSGLTIPGGATGLVRHFQLDSRPAQRTTLELTSLVAVVHPGRAAAQGGGGGSVNISYNTTADATVQVGITKNGHLIRTVDSGATTRAAGSTQVVWDMKDNQGQTVPGDIYAVEVRAQDSQGHKVRQIVPLTIPGR